MKRSFTTNALIFTAAFALCFLSFWPLISKGISGIFFSIDPDVMYIANSFLFYKTGNIYYFDQPGTPAIMIMSGALFVLSLFVKIFDKASFVLYSLNNLDLIIFYLRSVQTVILFVALAVSFSSLYKLTQKRISIVVLTSLLLLFTPFYYLGVSVSAEATSFMLVSLWLASVVNVLAVNSKKGVGFIFLLAGLAFAARATNFFLIPASFVFISLSKKNDFINNIENLIVSGLLTVTGFLVGILPVIPKVKLLITNIFSFASSSEIHGAGKKVLFDFEVYSVSARELIGSNRESAFVFLMIAILFVYGIFMKDKIFKKISLAGLVFCFGVLVFAKFPLAHYQTFNYFAAVFLAVPLILKIFKNYAIIIPIVLSIYFIPAIFKNYSSATGSLINEAAAVDKFVKQNAKDSINLWQWSRSKDFTIVWSRDYAPIAFDKSISKMKHPIYELVGDYTVRITNTEEKELFDACWDNLFIQEGFLENLTAKYPQIIKYKTVKIEGAPLYFIKSPHCVKKQ